MMVASARERLAELAAREREEIAKKQALADAERAEKQQEQLAKAQSNALTVLGEFAALLDLEWRMNDVLSPEALCRHFAPHEVTLYVEWDVHYGVGTGAVIFNASVGRDRMRSTRMYASDDRALVIEGIWAFIEEAENRQRVNALREDCRRLCIAIVGAETREQVDALLARRDAFPKDEQRNLALAAEEWEAKRQERVLLAEREEKEQEYQRQESALYMKGQRIAQERFRPCMAYRLTYVDGKDEDGKATSVTMWVTGAPNEAGWWMTLNPSYPSSETPRPVFVYSPILLERIRFDRLEDVPSALLRTITMPAILDGQQVEVEVPVVAEGVTIL